MLVYMLQAERKLKLAEAEKKALLEAAKKKKEEEQKRLEQEKIAQAAAKKAEGTFLDCWILQMCCCRAFFFCFNFLA